MAERVIAVAKLRIRLLREAQRLLPAAIRQATDAKNPSPALLRLIARLSTQRTIRDRKPR